MGLQHSLFWINLREIGGGLVALSIIVLGVITLLSLAYETFIFVNHHFLHHSKLSRYQHPKNRPEERAWALVTGASDGIGKGFAGELCRRGFNVIIHGRNQGKLQGVADDLKKQYPEASIQLAVLDAYPISEKTLDKMIAGFKDLHITGLVNNVGGSGPISPIFRQLSALSYEDVSTLIGINLDFPVMLTSKLLPLLRTRQPALVVNVGSFTGNLQSPYLSVYAGTKAYIESWSRSLACEMKADGYDIEVMGLIVGEVQSSWDREKPTSFTRCSSARLATDALDKVGCGRRIVTPYIGHALPGIAMKFIPERVADSILIGIAKQMKQKDEELASKQA